MIPNTTRFAYSLSPSGFKTFILTAARQRCKPREKTNEFKDFDIPKIHVEAGQKHSMKCTERERERENFVKYFA